MGTGTIFLIILGIFVGFIIIMLKTAKKEVKRNVSLNQETISVQPLQSKTQVSISSTPPPDSNGGLVGGNLEPETQITQDEPTQYDSQESYKSDDYLLGRAAAIHNIFSSSNDNN